MDYDEIIGARLSVLEARIAALEQQLFVLQRGNTVAPKRRKRELTPEEREAVRDRLVAGQERARARREAEDKVQAETTKKEKKEAINGTPEATDKR
jgi:hypothetical protein